MSTIIHLDTVKRKRSDNPNENIDSINASLTTNNTKATHNILSRATNGFISIVHVLLALLWTPLNWIFAVDCFFQLLRAVYYWNDPSIHAGWTFLLHFTIYVGLIMFISAGRKKRLSHFSR